ncbi:MAG: hypothetical protein IKP22_14730 [Clostridia bacterium]|nr:hypothetical protein [Clostridia bacterium]
MKAKRCLAAGLAAFFAAGAAACFGEEPGGETLTVTRMESAGAGGSLVAYPLLTGSESASRISADVFSSARVGEYLALLNSLSGGGTGLQMDYTLIRDPAEGMVSVVLSAKGRMLEGRPSQVWYPLVYHLEDGSRVTAEDVFEDPDAACGAIGAYLEEYVEEGLSDYLENRELYPVPMDSFALCERGVIFYYDHDALCFLSGFSGEVLIPYRALEGLLRQDFIPNEGEGAETVFSCLEEGRLRGVPVKLGEDLESTLLRLRSTVDPSWWPGGECYETEDARMRGVLIVSMDGSGTVDAILARGEEADGFIPGAGERKDWRGMLGEPDDTAAVAPGDPLEKILGTGEADIYRRGDCLLALHAGDEGKLTGVLIAISQKGIFE